MLLRALLQCDNTALHFAAQAGHAACVALLVARGADTEAANYVRTRALRCALRVRCLRCLRCGVPASHACLLAVR
jgi:hypothetical protein